MRNLIKKILKESDDLDWLRDVSTPSDVAKFIADNTKIVSDKEIYLPFPLFQNVSDPYRPVTYKELGESYTSFAAHCKKQYGLNDRSYYLRLSDKEDTREAWDEYKKIIGNKLFFLKSRSSPSDLSSNHLI